MGKSTAYKEAGAHAPACSPAKTKPKPSGPGFERRNGIHPVPAQGLGLFGKTRKLSAREMDVLAGILEGKTLGETAVELGISDKTVGTYKNRLFHKLGVKSAVELVGMYNCGNGEGSLFQ